MNMSHLKNLPPTSMIAYILCIVLVTVIFVYLLMPKRKDALKETYPFETAFRIVFQSDTLLEFILEQCNLYKDTQETFSVSLPCLPVQN